MGKREASSSCILWTDGASRGNPGPSGAGAVLKSTTGERLGAWSEALGIATNNEAEYRALLLGLERALELGVRDIEVRADSQLMIRQLLGEYRVKNRRLQALQARAMDVLAHFESYRLVHVPRSENREADRLANDALKH